MCCPLLAPPFLVVLVVVLLIRTLQLGFPGNLGSFLSSRAFLLRYQGEGWDVYFKPFSPAGFLLLISAIALGAQLVWLFSEQKKKAAFSKKERKSP